MGLLPAATVAAESGVNVARVAECRRRKRTGQDDIRDGGGPLMDASPYGRLSLFATSDCDGRVQGLPFAAQDAHAHDVPVAAVLKVLLAKAPFVDKATLPVARHARSLNSKTPSATLCRFICSKAKRRSVWTVSVP